MVTTTVRPSLRYSPLSSRCEKRPELSLPKSLTPFSFATLLARPSNEEGLAPISMRSVLAIVAHPSCRFAEESSSSSITSPSVSSISKEKRTIPLSLEG
jgi:hypothetical protein